MLQIFQVITLLALSHNMLRIEYYDKPVRVIARIHRKKFDSNI